MTGQFACSTSGEGTIGRSRVRVPLHGSALRMMEPLWSDLALLRGREEDGGGAEGATQRPQAALLHPGHK